MKRLYVAEVTYRFVVVADSVGDALRVADDEFMEVVGTESGPTDMHAHEMRGTADLPRKWDTGCLPYGGDDDATIGEHLTRLAEAGVL